MQRFPLGTVYARCAYSLNVILPPLGKPVLALSQKKHTQIDSFFDTCVPQKQLHDLTIFFLHTFIAKKNYAV